MPRTEALTDKQRTPTAAIAKKAEKGLALRHEHGRGGTEVGVRRAHQLAHRSPVSEKDIKSMYSYFARHAVDKRGKDWANPHQPSAGYIAWLLWGGEPAKAWVGRLHERLKAASD